MYRDFGVNPVNLTKPAKMPFRATNAANWSSIIRTGAKMAVIRRRMLRTF